MIKGLQDEVIVRLKAALPGVKVEPFPDRPEAAMMTGAKGSVFVHYLGTEYLNPDEIGPAADPADYPVGSAVKLEILVASLGINGGGGGLVLIESVVSQLSGWRPGGFLEMQPLFSKLSGREGNLWLYSAQFSVIKN